MLRKKPRKTITNAFLIQQNTKRLVEEVINGIDIFDEELETNAIEATKEAIDNILDLYNAVYQDLIIGAIKPTTELLLWQENGCDEFKYEIKGE